MVNRGATFKKNRRSLHKEAGQDRLHHLILEWVLGFGS